MIESAPPTRHTGDLAPRQASNDEGAGAAYTLSLEQALGQLMRVLDSGAADLFAVSPFPGDAATGQSVDAYVDESVAALRRLRTGADELQRALAIRARRRGGGA